MTFHYTYNYPQVARDGGFKLRNYKDGPLDWRLVGSIEIERILRDQSFEKLDAVLSHLSEVPLGSILDSNILDSGIAKYFMLSQFSVQYLLFCRKFLEESIIELRESHNSSQLELSTTKRTLSEARNEIFQLHKKLTQIEAIHEVLYPCHLCTKNFVNNDALNLHISRKHNGSSIKPEKNPESSHVVSKDRGNDLTLINTIKLELEIKHLKERINNAEREIKEKNLESEIKNSLEKSEINSVHSIGIQSNLSDVKEKDDSGQDKESTFQNLQQMSFLQERLQDFEKWREDQKHQNSVFLNEVNSKIQEINATLEITRNQIEIQISDEKQKPLASAEELEKLLTKKVDEIGKTTAANLEEVVKKLEVNYKQKIQTLEKELNQLNKNYALQKDSKTNELNGVSTQGSKAENQNLNSKSADEKEINANRYGKTKDLNKPAKEKPQIKETSDSESNHTFVKFVDATNPEKSSNMDEKSFSSSAVSDDDCTDFSVSLPDEEILGKTLSKEEYVDKCAIPHTIEEKKKSLQQISKSKIMSKADAKKLANNRLSLLGLDTKAKSLTPHLKNRYLDNLNESRIKFKQKNLQFYATRNKIKKFVDKLCSTKMPSNAEALLKLTKQTKPKFHKYSSDDEYSLPGKEEAESLKASTPLNEHPIQESGHFKQRLERILASPIRKPDNHNKPIPMPRKRVMFKKTEEQEENLNGCFRPADSNDLRVFERFSKKTL